MRHPFLILCFTFSCIALFGQGGIVANTGLHSFNNQDESISAEGFSQGGWHLGLNARLGDKKIYFCPGFAYYNMPIEATDQVKFFSSEASFHLFHIPASAAYKIYFSEKIGMRLEVGLNANYFFVIDEHDQIGRDRVNDIFFGGHGILGFDIYALVLNLKLHRGLTNAYVDVPGSQFNGWSVSAGFFF